MQANESIVERTDSFDIEIGVKQQLLRSDLANYCQSIDGSEAAQREGSGLLIGERCLLIDAAKKIQEDVVILRGDPSSGHPILAGVVCFPSGWTIADKIGQGIDTVHGPVPEYAEVMSRATNQLLERLKPGRPVWRTNWGIRPSGRLDQSPKQMEAIHAAASRLTADQVGQECYFRVERQTLSRLAETNDILFTIHTHQCPVSELESPQKFNLLGVLKTCPQETLRYKGIEPIADPVCQYLEKCDGMRRHST